MSNIDDEPQLVSKPAKSKKMSALVKNAVKAQTPSEEDEDANIPTNTEDEPQFSKLAKAPREYDENVVSPAPIKVSKSQRATNTQEPQLTTTSQIPTGRTCPGCYHCNWTGVNPEGYGCAMHYYGSQN